MKLQLVDDRYNKEANIWDKEEDRVISNYWIDSAIEDLKQVKMQKKAIEVQIEALENHIKKYMGEYQVLKSVDGVTLVTWKEEITTRFDSARFKKEDSKLYNVYTVCNLVKRFLVK